MPFTSKLREKLLMIGACIVVGDASVVVGASVDTGSVVPGSLVISEVVPVTFVPSNNNNNSYSKKIVSLGRRYT